MEWVVGIVWNSQLVRIFENQGYEPVARILSWITYGWMGLLFLNFSLFLPLAIVSALLFLVRRCVSAFPGFVFLTQKTSFAVLFLSLMAFLYGLNEAYDLRLEKLSISTDKMPQNETIRIVQLSDLHLGLMNRAKQLQPVMAMIQEVSPDLLVVTGDMVDGRIAHVTDLISLWKTITPPMGKFVVTGNHELYAGLEQSLEFLDAAGFSVLQNQEVIINNQLRLLGVDDIQINKSSKQEFKLFQNKKSSLFTVLLKHQPVVEEKSEGLFDLQLSGHAHRGQIFPFNYITGLVFPMQDGLYELSGGGNLYTSRGTMTWGPPIRLLAPPEITLIEIVGTGLNVK